jgi:glycosyltransferase involved in cell wall biosynthesis
VSLFADASGALFRRATEKGLPVEGLAGLFGVREIAQRLRGMSPVLLHAHDSGALRLGIRVGGKLGLPVVLSRRVASPLRRNPLSARKYSARRIDAVIAISQTVKDVFIRGGYPPERVHVVPSGLDIEALLRVESDAALIGRRGEAVVVGGMGKLSRKKNWQFMVRVAAAMKEEADGIRWVLAGDGPERARLEKLAARLGVEDRFEFLGFRPEGARLLKCFDLLFFPSRREGASVTVREAMVLGVPVVAVNAPGSMESLAGHGWSVADDDVEGAVRSVREALFDAGRRQAVIDGARGSALERFSFERTVEGTLAVYGRVIEGRPASADAPTDIVPGRDEPPPPARG